MTAGATGGIATFDCTCHMTFISNAHGVTDMATKTLEYTYGWNSAMNACVLNPYGYDSNERAVRWEQGRSDALRAFGII